MDQPRKGLHLQSVLDSLSSVRYLYCVDLEATCDEIPEGAGPEVELQVKPEEMETIELGLVVLDLSTLEVVDEFQRFVRPTCKPTLTAFCKSLTSISQHEVDTANTYLTVSEELRLFTTQYGPAAWASWGDYDAKQLIRDAAINSCTVMLNGLTHHNAKRWHWKILDCQAMGLKPAVESMGLPWQGTYHRGIDDARNLSQVIRTLLS